VALKTKTKMRKNRSKSNQKMMVVFKSTLEARDWQIDRRISKLNQVKRKPLKLKVVAIKSKARVRAKKVTRMTRGEVDQGVEEEAEVLLLKLLQLAEGEVEEVDLQ
jgi:hypothetical protein